MTQTPSRDVQYFGSDEAPAETRILTAGPLSAVFEAGNLRYIRYGGAEAIRAISYVTRDAFWGTDAPEFRDLTVEEGEGGFSIAYTATCARGEERFTYRARIEGTPTSLRFEATGAGDTDFVTCRTGFVVLHGVEGIVGAPVTVDHVDGHVGGHVGGRVTESVFPEIIDPDCPFRDIRALTHQVAPGLKVRCEMTGDTFEMEDQRNWTDASFKTYVRPLALPKPYTLKAGEAVTQAVTLTFEGAAPAASAAGEAISIEIGEKRGVAPEIGMWVDLADLPAALGRLDQLGDLRPAFLACYVDATTPKTAGDFDGLDRLAQAMATRVDLDIVTPGAAPEEELTRLADAAAAAGVTAEEVAVTLTADLEFVQPGAVFEDMAAHEALYRAARAAFPKARLGGGNFVYFTELNRMPVPAERLDFITHGTSALVHAADDRSVMESLECLPFVFASIRARYGRRRYRVAPAGIGSRTSPFGNDPTPNPDAIRVAMTNADPRQRGLLGAAWHLGYAARAAAAGVDALALGAPVGGFGLVHSPQPFAQPWFDEAGGVFPAFHVMRDLYAISGAALYGARSSAPSEIQALCVETPAGRSLFVANLTGEDRALTVGAGEIKIEAAVDEGVFPGGRSPAAVEGGVLRLGPYGCAALSLGA